MKDRYVNWRLVLGVLLVALGFYLNHVMSPVWGWGSVGCWAFVTMMSFIATIAYAFLEYNLHDEIYSYCLGFAILTSACISITVIVGIISLIKLIF